jgi:hypothetical protein
MRGLNLMNDKDRDAVVAFAPFAPHSKIKMILADGRDKKNVQFVKTTCGIDALVRKYRSLEKVGEALVNSDEEIDLENTGRFLGGTHKLYVKPSGEAAHTIKVIQVTRDPDGSEKSRTEASKTPANINTNIPVRWSGREFPKNEALRNYIFTRNYQLRHTSGLTYDFLYDMAKQLAERNTLLFVGAGKKGTDPLILSLGGTPYRGFLEGRVDGKKYMLILHLSNMELKEI